LSHTGHNEEGEISKH